MDGDDFILNVTDRAGNTTQTRLTAEQVLTPSQSTSKLQDHILRRYNPATTGIDPVLVTPVARIGLNEDAIGQNILLTLVDQHGARLTYALPVHIAEILMENLPTLVADLKNKKQTRQ